MSGKKRYGEQTAGQVKAWFAANSATMRVLLETDGNDYVGDSESVFISGDGREKMTASVSYEDGCPTCGGAYVKSWTLDPRAAKEKQG